MARLRAADREPDRGRALARAGVLIPRLRVVGPFPHQREAATAEAIEAERRQPWQAASGRMKHGEGTRTPKACGECVGEAGRSMRRGTVFPLRRGD